MRVDNKARNFISRGGSEFIFNVVERIRKELGIFKDTKREREKRYILIDANERAAEASSFARDVFSYYACVLTFHSR